MRKLMTLAIVLLVTTGAFAQAHDKVSTDDNLKAEIQKLFADLNAAITKKDRAMLEQLYADEFQFVRPSGAMATKATHIDGIMANDPVSSMPVPAPAIERLMAYGDVVISRGIVRGTAVTSIFVKKDGRWQLFQAQGTRLAPERNPVKLNPQLLDSHVGKYEFGPGAVATVTKEGETLKWRAGNRTRTTIVPLSETQFYAKESEAEITFVKNEKGQVTDAVLRVGACQDSKAKKIE